jgi:hypothetical protein
MEREFSLVKNAAFYLKLLADRLERSGDEEVAGLVAKSKFQIIPEFEYDNWDGGQFGHKVDVCVPRDLFLDVVDDKDRYIDKIKSSLDSLYSFNNEYICCVDLRAMEPQECGVVGIQDVVINNKIPSVDSDDIVRIWDKPENLRVFISHRDLDKIEASLIKSELTKYNVSCFVAHMDIDVSEEWLKEILRGLQTMDVFVTYMTNSFFESVWTNQEVGFALGRNIPIIPIKNMKNPEGFVSILQAQKYEKSNFCFDFISFVIESRSLPGWLKSKLIDGLVASLGDSSSWGESAAVYKLLKKASSLTDRQVEGVVNAFNSNSQVNQCIAVGGYDYRGKGAGASDICKMLKVWTGHDYKIEGKRAGNILGRVGDSRTALLDNMDDVPF